MFKYLVSYGIQPVGLESEKSNEFIEEVLIQMRGLGLEGVWSGRSIDGYSFFAHIEHSSPTWALVSFAWDLRIALAKTILILQLSDTSWEELNGKAVQDRYLEAV